MILPTHLKRLTLPVLLSLALTGCGGGTSFGEGAGSKTETPDTPTTETPTDQTGVSALEISASSRQLFSDGVNPVVISAIAKDKNNNVVSDAAITFKVNNDATILPDGANTGASVKTAKITPGLNHPENRTLDVEVTVGTLIKTLKIDIVGTTVAMEGPDSIAINKPTNYILKLQDSSNKVLAFHPVELTSSAGNVITPVNGFMTNATGEMSFTLTATAGGQDTITATALGATSNKIVSVSGNDFSLDSTSQEVVIGTEETINLKWSKDGVAQAGKTIQLSATRGVLSPITNVQTDANGEASFTIQSTSAGGTVITATTSDGLSAVLNREFVATTAHYINTQASPSVIAPHGVSSLIAKVRDVNDNPVKNQHIIFNLEDRVNGTLSSSQAVTDSLGRASVTYTSSDVSSEKNGVVIKTYVQENPSIADDITLTVGGSALRIVLGYDEKISESDIFYKKTYGVIVTDSAGRPVKDQAVDFTISPTTYYKGHIGLADTDGDGEADRWVLNIAATCPSEDLNKNGSLDDNEDENGNGRLEPTNDATVTAAGVTDEEGKLTVTVVYPQNRAWWSNQLITAKVLVKGTEFVENTVFGLHMLASDISNVEQTPPNYFPPYGVSADCSEDDVGAKPPVVIPVNVTESTPTEELCAEDVSLDADGSVFCVDSSSKAYVTAGESYKVTNGDFVFSPEVTVGDNDSTKVAFTVEGNIGLDSHNWSLNFAPKQDEPLQVGMYQNASRYPSQVATQPGLSFSGDGRANNELGGHFEILEVEYDDANILQKFAVNFLQYGEKQTDKWTLGKIRYKSTIPLSTSSNFPVD